MAKNYTALGLMSGTSGDGVDASLIMSDGIEQYSEIINRYFKYDQKIYENLHNLRGKILKIEDLQKNINEINNLEKEITLFHAKIVSKILDKIDKKVDLIGFHGQTIYHNSLEKISKQIGDGNLLSKLTKNTVIYNFRQNDIQNGGEGAPLAPVFHRLIIKQKKIELPVCILNIGGIANVTAIDEYDKNSFLSRDLGPGNCLIDEWVRNNTKKKFDNNGEIAKKGKTNDLILNQALDNFDNRPNQNTLSFDTKDFSLGFVRGLNLEDGAATLTDFTGRIIGEGLFSFLSEARDKLWKVLVCGGGRKNTTLIEKIKSRTLKNLIIQPIDDYDIDGDYVESQAFAYLAIRSYLGLPISFPKTTGCKEPTTGGVLIKNY
ncbi:anhydro-N-acetylmuramic acid kinase [Candidatus Pelagibacter sp.]|jgi:anhydro-N-acetylmuramic acid kinase|nr:anhydro-N-acetylmuramic acid kinase [Candidatus Pelagibacter sp.]|tara:strand:- start:451 stop:1578 length:1128 start_codon:yes stop_codon:yes gene_type:complete